MRAVHVLCLAPGDRRLLAARFAEHGNSHRRMVTALVEASAGDALARLRALRRLERRFAIDLGSLCHRDGRRDDAAVHPLERNVLRYVAQRRPRPGGGEDLLVLVDRVRQVRALIDEEAPPASPESAGDD
jgi:hypothetical protein